MTTFYLEMTNIYSRLFKFELKLKYLTMKKSIIPILVILFTFFTSCNSSAKVRGSGDVIQEIREVSSFDKIKIDGVVSVILIPGNEEKVIVETDDNLQPYIKVYRNGSTLIIDTDEDDFKSTKNNVYITFIKINEVIHNGVGSVKTDGIINASSFYFKNDGVGSAEIEIKCDDLIAKQGGVGSLKISGYTTHLELKNSGVGSVNAFNLTADYADVNNSGVGSTEVFANKELNIKSTGVGSVKYRGDAVIKSIEASGVGSVKKD